jgi:hypothetical protein
MQAICSEGIRGATTCPFLKLAILQARPTFSSLHALDSSYLQATASLSVCASLFSETYFLKFRREYDGEIGISQHRIGDLPPSTFMQLLELDLR